MPLSPALRSLLRDPVGLGPLELEGDALVNRAAQRRYLISDSIPVLLDTADLGPQNTKMQKMYSWMAVGFDLANDLFNLVLLGTIEKMRREMVASLDLKPGDRILYTSIGSGLDLPFLAQAVPLDALKLVGLDLSMEMLRKCQRRLRGHDATSMLVQANAERLPLAGQSFDVVMNVGGINLFDRPALAVQEMLRVARPGARMILADETPATIKSQYQGWNLFTRSSSKGISTNFDPRSWIPPEIKETSYREVSGGKMYFLSFKAPSS